MTTSETARAPQSSKRRLIGVVVRARMQKTVVVQVDRTMTHPKYRKQYRVSRRFAVHAPGGNLHEGDLVTIEETRPLSKTKRWRIVPASSV